jgi:hypothetical protein
MLAKTRNPIVVDPDAWIAMLTADLVAAAGKRTSNHEAMTATICMSCPIGAPAPQG